ncbi:MAG: dUTP diphosphatase [Chitinophagaceae bacterium]|uniref:dUTP diphosphatase n=1 Tax=unclassified Paraflavitalea TaxID=2798305 RepID=UPI003D358BE7|nr:dUTP diphosphatase [Chitinophagaceae bacterium]
MQTIKIATINRSENPLPEYATTGSSGMDLRANLTEPVSIKPLERILIPTGLFLEIPQGFEAQIRPRSGFAFKQGITVLNSPGTIDADYRGELKVLLVNLSNEAVTVNNGDRIAQMVFQKVESVQLIVAEALTDTDRGAGGFGHTGKQ